MSNTTITSIKVNEETGKKPKRVATQTQSISKRAEKKRDIVTKAKNYPQVQRDIINWMAGDYVPALANAHKFDSKFYSFLRDTERGVRAPITVVNGLASLVPENDLVNAIWAIMDSFPDTHKVELERIEKIVSGFVKVNHSKFLKTPPEVLCFEGEVNKIAFNRVVNPAPITEFYPSPSFCKLAPIFSEFLDRCSEKLITRQYFGSMFDMKAPRKLCLMFYGNPDAGKTTILRLFLESIFGRKGYTIFGDSDLQDKFYKERLIYKPALILDDIHPSLVRDLKFKNLSGGRVHNINPKGAKAFDATIDCRIMLTTNIEPELQPEDRARVVLCRVDDIAPEFMLDEFEIEERLVKEIPYIIADTLEAYRLLEGKRILGSVENLAEAIDSYDLPFLTLFEELFEVAPKEKSLAVTEFTRLVEYYGSTGRSKVDAKGMRDFVQRKFGANFRAVGWEPRTKSQFKAVGGIRKKQLTRLRNSDI